MLPIVSHGPVRFPKSRNFKDHKCPPTMQVDTRLSKEVGGCLLSLGEMKSRVCFKSSLRPGALGNLLDFWLEWGWENGLGESKAHCDTTCSTSGSV